MILKSYKKVFLDKMNKIEEGRKRNDRLEKKK